MTESVDNLTESVDNLTENVDSLSMNTNDLSSFIAILSLSLANFGQNVETNSVKIYCILIKIHISNLIVDNLIADKTMNKSIIQCKISVIVY